MSSDNRKYIAISPAVLLCSVLLVLFVPLASSKLAYFGDSQSYAHGNAQVFDETNVPDTDARQDRQDVAVTHTVQFLLVARMRLYRRLSVIETLFHTHHFYAIRAPPAHIIPV